MLPRRNFRQRLDRYPPILIRLLCTWGSDKYVPADVELATACGLTMPDFLFVSYSTNWDRVPTGIMWAFLKGCRVDLEKRRCFLRLDWMRKHGQFTHLHKSPLWPQFENMIVIWEKSETS